MQAPKLALSRATLGEMMAYLRSSGAFSGMLLTCLAFLFTACGGDIETDGGGEQPQDTGGSDTSGGTGGSDPSSGAGGATGGTSGGGGAPSGTGGDAQSGSGGAQNCCLAAAICDDGDEEIPVGAPCPANARCYTNTICCHTVQCIAGGGPVSCDAYPSCGPNERQVDSCPTDDQSKASCTPRSLCGNTIFCLSETCNPDTEYFRNYVGTPSSCPVIDFVCADDTQHFFNECGCGCEQPRDCPQYVDCMPGPGDRDPLCNSEECPYTQRAY